ncbi:hypothetical protein DM02DRAFT_623351 [Periconia macrospinosa]|uniref:Uncharacterized protein n=1 Tax=Periconia macrospinosa TaxID=97972 RepID=A0A2V1EB16_9PLEO|nr:hypothetical protein DM02DRAFT_623351 [Periconia macrospinosa]
MKYSGLYFISNPTAQVPGSEAICQSLSTGIERNFERANREEGGWNLSHIIFRNTQDTSSNQNGNANSYHHLLRLSYLNPNCAFSFIQQPSSDPPASQPTPAKDGSSASEAAQPPSTVQPAQGPIVSLPTEQFESFYSLILNQWTQLWTPQRALDIPPTFPGFTYTVPNFTIHIGALRARRSGPQTAGSLSPGVLVCITTGAGAFEDDDDDDDDDDDRNKSNGNDVDMKDVNAEIEEELDFSSVQEQIRGIWKMLTKGVDLGKSEMREVMQGAQGSGGNKQKGTEAADERSEQTEDERSEQTEDERSEQTEEFEKYAYDQGLQGQAETVLFNGGTLD